MTLSALLPKPKRTLNASKWSAEKASPETATKSNTASTVESASTPKQQRKPARTPAYGDRTSYLPVTIKDFFDGGAFPEINMVQYPLDMGRSQTSNTNRSTLPLQTDSDGTIRYDMILHQNKAEGKVLHSTYDALKPHDLSEETLMLPDEQDDLQTTERTKMALEKVIQKKIKTTQPSQVVRNASEEKGQPEFIKYTPQNPEHANGTSTRIIRMAHTQVDPFDPPKFRHQRIANPPGSPPAPVLHSPPRQVTIEERKSWIIPPCISNWKNAKGYTIPLDKRLAADGRGIQDVQINDNFAKLAEALYVADRHAREEVKIRSEMQMKLVAKEKKDKEDKLRLLAQKAREERAGIVSQQQQQKESESDESSSDEEDSRRRPLAKDIGDRIRPVKVDEKQKERDEMRRELTQQHIKSLRNPQKLLDRDISEKIALGKLQPTAAGSQYDQRLFNQSSGISSGFGGEDAYAIYDKPLFAGSSANVLYRAKANEIGEVDTEGLEKLLEQPHKGFSGADSGKVRQGPVEFEKEDEGDVFGVDKFLDDAKRGRDRGDEQASKKKRID